MISLDITNISTSVAAASAVPVCYTVVLVYVTFAAVCLRL